MALAWIIEASSALSLDCKFLPTARFLSSSVSAGRWPLIAVEDHCLTSRFPCMELLRVQGVSDSECRYAPRANRYAPCCLPAYPREAN